MTDLHLLRNVPEPTHRYEGAGDNVVKDVHHQANKVWINATQHFTDVPQDVWEYEIGAYQVCQKWLKDRKNKPLSHEEVNRYRQILLAISQTLRIMSTIDNH